MLNVITNFFMSFVDWMTLLSCYDLLMQREKHQNNLFYLTPKFYST